MILSFWTPPFMHKMPFLPLAAALLLLTLAAGPVAAQSHVFTWQGPRLAIPDADPEGLEIPLEVSDVSGTIASLAVHFEGTGLPTALLGDRNSAIDHPFVNDLEAVLVSPAGTEVTLFSRIVPSEEMRNVSHLVLRDDAAAPIQRAIGEAPFASDYQPKEPLSGFEGENPNGTWLLRIADLGEKDEGGISRWGIQLSTTQEQAPVPPMLLITDPVTNRTVRPATNFRTVSGLVLEESAAVDRVEYRVLTKESDPETTPWQLATNASGDWSVFTFGAPLVTGSNQIEARARGTDGVWSHATRRTVVRDEIQYTDPRPDFASLQPNSEVWAALGRVGMLASATMISGPTGFAHEPVNNWKALAADFTGNGFLDLATITYGGQVYLAPNTGDLVLESPRLIGGGILSNEYEGYGAFAGDFNGNGFADMLQIRPDGAIIVAWGNGETLADPQLILQTDFRYRPNEGHWIGIGDVTGNGMEDIVYVAPNGAVRVVRVTPEGFLPPNNWHGPSNFRYNRGTPQDPMSAQGLLLLDYNGSGMKDLATITPDRVVHVLRSWGDNFWGVTSFQNTFLRFAPYQSEGWHIFVADMNSNGMEDLVQVNEFGEIAVSYSNGNRMLPIQGQFAHPLPRFHHNVLGPQQVFIGQWSD